MQQHLAPSGFGFTLRDPELVPERLRRPIAKTLMRTVSVEEGDGTSPRPLAEGEGPPKPKFDAEALDKLDELNDLLAVALVTDWTLPGPVTLAAVQDLPARDYAFLRSKVAPHATKMLPDFDEPSDDPDSPPSP